MQNKKIEQILHNSLMYTNAYVKWNHLHYDKLIPNFYVNCIPNSET